MYVTLVRLDGKEENVEYYNYKTFPYDRIHDWCTMRTGKYAKGATLNNFASFDIETSSLPGDESSPKRSWMYHWQMCVNSYVCVGRRWSEWIAFMRRLKAVLHFSPDRTFVIYVHNLGYEYQYMKKFLQGFGSYTIFAPQPRKPLSVRCDAGIEFRCSWKLTNMSLEQACKFEKGMIFGKQKGDLDYKEIRTPDTILKPKEIGYCVCDALCLWQLIYNRMRNEHDNLNTIPLTSTGYVRRRCRKECAKTPGYRDLFHSLEMTENVYNMLKSTARGGDTHANRYLSGRIWDGVDSFDVQSSYPYVMMTKKFPMTKFTPYGDVDSMSDFRKLLSTKACLFRVIFENIRLKKHIAMPYISVSKCEHITGERLDNGRILSADHLCAVYTDIDFELIECQYEWDTIYIADMHIASYGDLPEPIKTVIMELYTEKCTLKLERAKAEKAGDIELYRDLDCKYMKCKNRLNGIFGMMYTDPVREIIEEQPDGKWTSSPADVSEALAKFYRSRNSFLYYAWGVWTTAHARRHLADLVEITGQDTTIYCDTDSSKAMNVDLKAIEEANVKIRQECIVKNAYVELEGERYYLGEYEHENASQLRFKTLGAKKYVLEEDGELKITISGVAKEEGARELATIYNFVPGFTFCKAGGIEFTYIEAQRHVININGCKFLTASAAYSEESTYELGITGEYCDLIGYNIYDDIEKSYMIIS